MRICSISGICMCLTMQIIALLSSSMAEYRFITSWQLEAPLQSVFDTILDSLHWPNWWRGAEYVEQLEPGDANGIGSRRRYTWKSLMGYRLCFDALASRVEPPHVLEATVIGDLKGYGRWTFCHDKGITTVCYEWHVHTTKHWMNLLAPVAHGIFSYNHHVLMRRGAEGLAHHLRARLIRVTHGELPTQLRLDHVSSRRMAVNWRCAGTAGVLAGIVATFVQLLLWWAASYMPIAMLLRDARLAAAIIMGQSVLPPPVTFDWMVMAAATVVHGILSVSYGLLLGYIVARLPMRPALLAGIAFGLLLFCVNMYGFTAIFPWFLASRDWVTALAHILFGLSGAFIYKLAHAQRAGIAQLKESGKSPSC